MSPLALTLLIYTIMALIGLFLVYQFDYKKKQKDKKRNKSSNIEEELKKFEA